MLWFFQFFLSLTLLLPTLLAQTVSSNDCASSVHVLLARGEGTGDDLNVLSTVQGLVLQQIPGSTVLGLPYDHGNSDKEAAAYNGSLLFQQYVQQYAASCPNSKIALLGYSLGAVALMDGICGTGSIGIYDYVAPLDPKYADYVIGIFTYGDETYAPFQPWNVGNCTIGAGIFPRLNSGACYPFQASLQSYCDYGDNQCCSPLPLDDNAAHHTYVEKYNQDVVNFIISRLG
ncbi:putative acetylxylan esterase precursor [Talaromyces proteolyticus]|uniref:Acetylxylan esterase n=1 Tax=Talaromyces proteolyticus TaxID=1131652 RepID=A0AAD4Q1Z8_9EURO|nr:putative acetylxylan esterase precursor [Talaromyces proteolyticus]KAH8699209.1 putative acetylxylan esterase precursor [Talaromyces proteolyticus]